MSGPRKRGRPRTNTEAEVPRDFPRGLAKSMNAACDAFWRRRGFDPADVAKMVLQFGHVPGAKQEQEEAQR